MTQTIAVISILMLAILAFVPKMQHDVVKNKTYHEYDQMEGVLTVYVPVRRKYQRCFFKKVKYVLEGDEWVQITKPNFLKYILEVGAVVVLAFLFPKNKTSYKEINLPIFASVSVFMSIFLVIFLYYNDKIGYAYAMDYIESKTNRELMKSECDDEY